LNLVYWGTGNPNPVLAGDGRQGDNLYTCSIVALDADSGKLVWYFQPSPHDTHDWDAVQTPMLFDGEFKGRRRQMVAQASRNGYFFVLDRKTGEHLLTTPFIETNWSTGINAKGQPIRNTAKDPSRTALLYYRDRMARQTGSRRASIPRRAWPTSARAASGASSI